VLELGKLLTGLATPLTVALLTLLYAAFALKRKPRYICLTAAALLLFFGSGPGAGLLLGSLENREPNRGITAAPQAQAIVVLGGGLINTSGPPGSVELGSEADRLWLAVELYRAGKSPLILISGGNVFDTKHLPESALAARVLIEWGIPQVAILTEEQSRDTHQNAVYTQRILAQKGITRILLVTSAFHMPRAASTFRRTGLTVIPIPADYFTGPSDQPLLLSILPTSSALNDSGLAIKEYLGLLVYHLRGWAD